MAGSKWYVVWKGVEPGIYSDWISCKRQVDGFNGPMYKSFPSREEAVEAYKAGPWDYIGKNKIDGKKTAGAGSACPNKNTKHSAAIIYPSLSVDAACSGNPGIMEYRGVETETGAELFHKGPFKNSTNNIGEFLALVHGLAMLKQMNSPLPIYTDSRTAMAWVRTKKAKTTLKPEIANPFVTELVARAENWLKNNSYTTEIYKWETENWGEIPADFGRK
ncbi:MAG: ribonuclease H family protein [Candidatus Symbiothrix sp.]|jgi:ribonuclease HI|nr:ribonuclease H family protein [Candidatus Symbiothrix sp.]